MTLTIKALLGPRGKMPILIRDDDTNFFTRADMLESLHSIVLGRRISRSVYPLSPLKRV